MGDECWDKAGVWEARSGGSKARATHALLPPRALSLPALPAQQARAATTVPARAGHSLFQHLAWSRGEQQVCFSVLAVPREFYASCFAKGSTQAESEAGQPRGTQSPGRQAAAAGHSSLLRYERMAGSERAFFYTTNRQRKVLRAPHTLVVSTHKSYLNQQAVSTHRN